MISCSPCHKAVFCLPVSPNCSSNFLHCLKQSDGGEHLVLSLIFQSLIWCGPGKCHISSLLFKVRAFYANVFVPGSCNAGVLLGWSCLCFRYVGWCPCFSWGPAEVSAAQGAEAQSLLASGEIIETAPLCSPCVPTKARCSAEDGKLFLFRIMASPWILGEHPPSCRCWAAPPPVRRGLPHPSFPILTFISASFILFPPESHELSWVGQ